jgi:hypothetical protein
LILSITERVDMAPRNPQTGQEWIGEPDSGKDKRTSLAGSGVGEGLFLGLGQFGSVLSAGINYVKMYAVRRIE